MSARYRTETGSPPPVPLAVLTAVAPPFATNFLAPYAGDARIRTERKRIMDIKTLCIIIDFIMNKKIIVISVLLLISVSFVGLYFGRVLKMKQNAAIETLPTPTPAPVKLLSWKDQSEFEFQYPEYLNLNPHEEDTENYAHIEMTSPENQGSLILWTRDTKYQTVDDYILAVKPENYIGSTLGDLPAVKILDSVENKIKLITVRNGFLYEIEVNNPDDKKSADFWTDVFDTVSENYVFYQPDSSENPVNNPAPPASGDDGIYFEEELIE